MFSSELFCWTLWQLTLPARRLRAIRKLRWCERLSLLGVVCSQNIPSSLVTSSSSHFVDTLSSKSLCDKSQFTNILKSAITLTWAMRSFVFCYLVRAKFPHTFTGKSIAIATCSVPMIVAAIEEVFDLIIFLHRFATLDRVIATMLPFNKRGICQWTLN